MSVNDNNVDGFFSLEAVVIVLILTIFLVMFFAGLTHLCLKKAWGHRLSTSILESLFHELTVIGFVELFFFLFEKYTYINHESELFILHTHFAIFFGVLFYAGFIAVASIVAIRVYSKSWDEIEGIDVDKYIEARHEIQALELELNISQDDDHTSTSTFDLLKSFFDFKKRRHLVLLNQLRFHELRASFLTTHKLPSNFLLSFYLRKSLNVCIIDIVEIRIYTYFWTIFFLEFFVVLNSLLEVAGVNFYSSAYEEGLDGSSITSIGISAAGLAFALLLELKLILVNRKIMADNRYIGADTDQVPSYQIELFWFHNPRIILHAWQIVGWLFSLYIGLIFSFMRSELEGGTEGAFTSNQWFWLVVGVYLCLVWLCGRGLVRYVFATSLGQLTNESALSEVVAGFRLEENKKKNNIKNNNNNINNNININNNNNKNRRKFLPKTHKSTLRLGALSDLSSIRDSEHLPDDPNFIIKAFQGEADGEVVTPTSSSRHRDRKSPGLGRKSISAGVQAFRDYHTAESLYSLGAEKEEEDFVVGHDPTPPVSPLAAPPPPPTSPPPTSPPPTSPPPTPPPASIRIWWTTRGNRIARPLSNFLTYFFAFLVCVLLHADGRGEDGTLEFFNVDGHSVYVFEGLLLALFVVELLLDLTSQSALFICIGAWDAVVTLPSVSHLLLRVPSLRSPPRRWKGRGRDP